MNYAALSDKEEEIGKAIMDSAYPVHKTLGSGLLEYVYEICFCHELTRRGLSSQCSSHQGWDQSLDFVTLCLSDLVFG